MRLLSNLFDNNRAWASDIKARDKDFFGKLATQQNPDYLWIGCADSRVPANEIVGLLPGELFVHRNVANLVVHSDLNCLSVMQFAVDVLEVEHIIVCGHYGCGGVRAALEGERHGLIDNWLRHIQDIRDKHAHLVDSETDLERRCDRLCELNVIEQTVNVCKTTVIQDAWMRGQGVSVHGWIYDIKDGLLQDLGICITAGDEIAPAHAEALAQIRKAPP